MNGRHLVAQIDMSRLAHLKLTGDLPSPKGVALAIMRAAQGDDASTSELAQIVKTDPAFVGRLIKAANGVVGYGRRSIASVQDALMILGMPAVRNLALGFSLLSSYREGACRRFDYNAHWATSLMRAVALQAVVRRTRVAPADEAYCLGLLSRIGELGLATIYPEQYGDIFTAFSGQPDVLLHQETSAFALNHLELSAMMLTDWGIPGVYASAVLHHERPFQSALVEGSSETGMCLALALAAQISRFCVTAPSDQPALVAPLREIGHALGFEPSELYAMCDQVVREWSEWAALLRVQVRPIDAFADLARCADDSVVERRATRESDEPSIAPAAVARPILANQSADVGGGQPHMRVLLVENDAAVRSSIRALLDGAGHEVQEADSIELAAELALLMQPHMMIIGWSLPDGSGLNLVDRLRQTRVGRRIYVLVLTSHENEQRLVDAFECGVDDFLTRPINERVLMARLRAGQRVVRLHQEVERDREEIRQFAAELAISNRRLAETALTDVLTGFPNRRYFRERLQQEWSASSRHQRGLACLTVSISGFRQISQTYGRDVGDAVVKHAAEVLKQCLRTHDVVARTGDDAFSVLCPEMSLEAARLVAERIRSQIASAPVSAARLQLSVSLCIGVGVRGGVNDSPDAFLKRASATPEAENISDNSPSTRDGILSEGSALGPVMH